MVTPFPVLEYLDEFERVVLGTTREGIPGTLFLFLVVIGTTREGIPGTLFLLLTPSPIHGTLFP